MTSPIVEIDQEVKQKFRFETDSISITEICELLGYDEDAPEPFNTIIIDELSLLPNYLDIEGGYTIHEATLDAEQYSLKVQNQNFEIGKTVGKLIRNTEYVAVFVCTAGKEISERSKLLMDQGLLMEGYVADLIGSTLVERAMDRLQSVLKKQCTEAGLLVTNRYSPGYSEWLVKEQQNLFQLFPANYCGVTLTESSLMIPSKSVSGVIGIGKEVRYTNYSCSLCSSVNCLYRNRKKKSDSANQNASPCQR